MKHTGLPFIFLLFSNFVFSQNLQIIKNPFILPHGHTMFALGSLGASNITNDAANVGLVNPAALNEHKSIKIALSYQFETNIDDAWLTGIGHKRLSKSIPQSGAVIFPIENFRAGFSFKQTYNSKADLGKIEVTTSENPDGIGKFYEPVFETTLFSYSLGTSYKFDRVFTEDASLAIGIRITLNELKYDEGLENYALTFNDRNYNWSAGVIYSHYLPDNKFIKGGLYYESNLNIESSVKYNYQSNLETSHDFPIQPIIDPIKIKGTLPTKLKLDLESNFVKHFTFHAGVNFIKWDDVNENLKNQIELTANGNYNLSNLVKINLGLFFTDLNYETDIINLNESLEALYVTAGVNLEYSFVNFGVTIADSHLLSDDWRKQTLLNCNISVSL